MLYLMPDSGQEAMQLGISQAVSGDGQQGDQAGVDQQAVGALPAIAHAHHVVQEDLRECPAGQRTRLQQPQ